MTSRWMPAGLAILLAVILSGPAGAQDSDSELAIPTEEVDLVEAPEAPAQTAPADVWWGNRSIAYGNYIRFDRINLDAARALGAKVDDGSGLPYFDKIFFDLDKAVLRPEGRAECDKIVAYLNTYRDVDVIIEGHTCDLASEPYNVGLGQRRADAVARYLQDRGISPARMTTRTYGEATPWKGIEQRELNRRAVVIVVPGRA